MKKRLGLVIIIIAAIFITGLLVWRFWSCSSSGLISVDENAVTGFDAYAMLHRFDNGQPGTDTYRIENEDPQGSKPEEILEILATSGYRQDFRNLLPWGIDGADADKNYDGRIVKLYLYYEDRYIEFTFLSSSVVVVTTSENPNMRIYHPTNRETLDKLVDYLQAYGVKQ